MEHSKCLTYFPQIEFYEIKAKYIIFKIRNVSFVREKRFGIENSPWTSTNSNIGSGLILQFELIQVHDEERLEHRVHKIEDNLCSKEPYLAQLFGTDSLSKDQENQIRWVIFFSHANVKCLAVNV